MTKLSAEFAMKDLGSLSYFLGIAVTHNAQGLFLSQSKYAANILDRAGMTDCKSTPTPVATTSKLSASSTTPYANLLLLCIVLLQVLFSTSLLPGPTFLMLYNRFTYLHDPKVEHMAALHRILRYLKGALDHGLQLYRSSISSLLSYTDADWGGCPHTRQSTSGYCVFLGDNLISWSSKRQPILSKSSAEAEYRGDANVVSKTCWLCNLLLELHCPLMKATLVYCDNVSAIYLSDNPVHHQHTKHIEIDIHFVREKVKQGEVCVLHVPSQYQIADILIKGLPKILFDEFFASLSVRKPPDSTARV
ncbi:uncharacterized mitochondrial protein AtMg00810-like [Amaranthus tricolor]|uniref:uncharacterized mitochondrial protein AtMg00810-like n=1 Tax=Amaranthus tricolor TaxID=29722 RepID=UPI0025871FA9|nr:uncharacterized mitochondrial protein AtMg00810-like [Amaranthus tricolor]